MQGHMKQWGRTKEVKNNRKEKVEMRKVVKMRRRERKEKSPPQAIFSLGDLD